MICQYPPDLALVDPDHLTQNLRAIVTHGGLSKGLVVGVLQPQYDQTETTAPSKKRKIIYVIA